MSEDTRPDNPLTPAEEIYAVFLRGRTAGDAVDIEALCAAHPEHDAALRVLALADEFPGEPAACAEIENLVRDKLGGGEDGPAALPGRGGAERYIFGREIARGGMGVIHEVWDDDFGRKLAMKIVRDPDEVERFLAEARVTGRLEHPGVVPVHELGLDSCGRAYFTMALVEGDSLEKVFRKCAAGEDGWTRPRVLGVLVRVCDTVAYAHSRGIIHRDLKPENIMVGRFGETYVMDWGLARIAGGAAPSPDLPLPGQELFRPREPERGDTARGTVLGTPAYMPPEQAAGETDTLDERSDVYAVGAMLYTLLAGRRPFAGDDSRKSSRQIVEAVLRGPPEPLHVLSRDAPAELVAICERAMARTREARYATMNALGDDLRAFLENRVVRAHRTGAAAELRKWIVRNRSAAGAIGVLILSLAAFLVWQEVTRGELESERNQKGEALVRARDALSEREEALRRSEANRLTALSVAQLPGDPALALLLALEGAARDPGAVAANALIAALGNLREKRTLGGHNSRVTTVDFDPSGNRILTTCLGGTVSIRDVATGEEQLLLAAGEPLFWGLFDPSGRRVLTAGRGGVKLQVWDAGTGVLLEVLTFTARIGDLGLAPRGEWFIVATDDGRVSFLDGRTLSPVKRLRVRASDAPDTRILAVDLHPDGERLIAVGSELVAIEWDVRTRRQTGLAVSDCMVARYSPDGERLIVGSPDGGARILDAGTGSLIGDLVGHRDELQGIAFLPDGRSALSASSDGTARLWDLGTRKTIAVLAAHLGDVLGVSVSRDGRHFATASYDATARLWSARPPLFVGSTPDALAAGPILVTPDGKRVLHSRGRDVEIREPESGKRVLTISGHSGLVLVAAYSPDGRRIVTGTTDASDGVRVWNVEDGRLVATFLGHRAGVLTACFDSLGERVISTSLDETPARIFDARTGDLLAVLQGHTARVYGAAFSEDGNRVATGAHDGTIRTWDAATGHPQWQERAQERVHFVGFFAGDTTIIAGTYRSHVYVLDGASGKIQSRFGGRSGTVLQAAYHAEKELVATRSSDTTTRVWSVSTGEEVLVIPAPERGFRHVAFSTGGERLYTLAGECDLQAWPLDPLLAATASRPRDLTPLEHERFEIGTSAERKAYRKDWVSRRMRRDLAAADRAVILRPDDWRARGHSIGVLRTYLQVFLPLGERGDLEPIEKLLRDAALDPHADWSHLFSVAETQRLAGRHLDALETLERAIQKPIPGPEVARALAELRASFLPDLVTFDSIDAALEEASETIVAPGAAWRFFRGRSEPSPGLEWTQPEFDDGSWEAGASSFGHDDSAGFAGGTALEDMKGSYTTVYARRRVVLADPDRWSALVLSIRADDGFVAYIDGEEVGRGRAGPAGLRMPFDAVADAAAAEPPPAHEIRLAMPPAAAFLIAIQGLNRARDNGDFLLLPELRGEIRPRVTAVERGGDLRQEILRASGPDADARTAYLEGRMLQLGGNPAAALARFEAAAAALGGRTARPEPFLRIAECLDALDRAADAEERLHSALSRGMKDSERVWDRWLTQCFGRLGWDAAAALGRIPPSTAEYDRLGRGGRLRALLESLAADGTVRINCGGEEYVSKDGSRWLADAFHTGGFRYFGDRFGGAPGPCEDEIQGTDDDPLFRTERWFPWEEGKAQGYTIPLPRGRWRVVLHFAEIHCKTPCGRTFDVLVEGEVIARDFDPAAAGIATASSLSHDVEVADGRLEIELPVHPGRMQPKVSAIEVRRQ